MSSITLAPVNRTIVKTPKVGHVTMFFDSLDNGTLKYKTSSGTFVTIGANGVINSGSANYQIVDSIFDRNSIENESRLDGMLVYVKNTTNNPMNPSPTTFRLEGGISNTNWKKLDIYKEEIVVDSVGRTEFTTSIKQDPYKPMQVFVSGILLPESMYSMVDDNFTWNVPNIDLEVGEILTFFIKN